MATTKGSSPVRSELHSSYFQAMYVKRGQQVSFTGSSASSGTLDSTTSLVKVFPTQDCWIKVGASGISATVPANAVSASSEMFLAGGIVDYVGIPPDTTDPVIAVISNGNNGILYITEAT